MGHHLNNQPSGAPNPVGTQHLSARTLLASLLLILLLPYESPAPISGVFPGLSELLEHADAVVVADILEKPRIDFGDGGVFQIRIRKVLQGQVDEGRTYSAYLRDLGFWISQTNCPSLFPAGLVTGARGAFFLNKSKRAEPKAEFWNENCEGDAFAVNPKADLRKLTGLRPRAAIEALLTDSLAYYGKRFPDYKAALTNMLASP